MDIFALGGVLILVALLLALIKGCAAMDKAK